jgi:solute:Na+ symporter, SSS family
MILMLDHYAPVWLAGLLGAGIMAAVMASDSQILALSTMFTEDIFTYYGGKERFGEAVQVYTGACVHRRRDDRGVYRGSPRAATHLRSRRAVRASGFAAMLPLLVGALFWRRQYQVGRAGGHAVDDGRCHGDCRPAVHRTRASGPPAALWTVSGVDVISRTPGGTAVLGFLPVVPMTLISALLMWTVSLATPKPSAATIHRYFKPRGIAQ